MVQSVIYVEKGEKKEMKVDYLLSSMPLKNLIEGMKNVLKNVERIAKGLPYRDFVTVGFLVKKLQLQNQTKWKTINNMIPDCWLYIQESERKLGRIQIFNNWSPYLVQKTEENVWIGLEYFCQEGDEYWNMTEVEWKQFSKQELEKMEILVQGTEILDYHVEKVVKAYPAYFDTYAEIDTLKVWLNNFSNLFCIGRNGQHRYNNMDHSMLTAFEAVENILTGEMDKRNIWAVNAEKEYHEVKKC